jgi:hypothetical protein
MRMPYTLDLGTASRRQPGVVATGRRPGQQGKRVSHASHRPGERLAALARDEFEELGHHLARARAGRDRALHKARKTLQRLRAIVRLLAPVDAALAREENARLSRWRRRLAPLRDAAARRQTFRVLAARPRWKAHAPGLEALARIEAERHRAAWAAHPADSSFWVGVEREHAALGLRIAQWPFDAISTDTIDAALQDAAKRLRKRVAAASGQHGRELRHELRRKLRRLANLRRAAAVARGVEDAAAQDLLSAAKRCGHEGDLWMAVSSARRAARERPALRPVLRALEAERQAMCRRHDRVLDKLGLR